MMARVRWAYLEISRCSAICATAPASLVACDMWHDQPPPPIPAAHCQKEWDTPKVRLTADLLLNGASDAVSHAHLLATATKELGA